MIAIKKEAVEEIVKIGEKERRAENRRFKMKHKTVCIKLFCKQKPLLKIAYASFCFAKRNISLVKLLKLFKRKVCYDPLLSNDEIEGFGVKALDNFNVKLKMDGVIVAVAHDEFKRFSFSTGFLL